MMNNDVLISHSEHNSFWVGMTGKERYQAIQEIEQCVNRFGFISEFKQFSDLDLNICIEVEASKLSALYQALQTVIHVEDKSQNLCTPEKDQIVYLHLSFLKGLGKMTNEVPAVPG